MCGAKYKGFTPLVDFGCIVHVVNLLACHLATRHPCSGFFFLLVRFLFSNTWNSFWNTCLVNKLTFLARLMVGSLCHIKPLCCDRSGRGFEWFSATPSRCRRPRIDVPTEAPAEFIFKLTSEDRIACKALQSCCHRNSTSNL